jgi:hypothetical protein
VVSGKCYAGQEAQYGKDPIPLQTMRDLVMKVALVTLSIQLAPLLSEECDPV